MSRLDDAIRRHRAAQEGIEAAKERAEGLVRKARARAEEAREELHAAIVEATLAGTPQKEIVRRTELARETVRTVLRRRGVEP